MELSGLQNVRQSYEISNSLLLKSHCTPGPFTKLLPFHIATEIGVRIHLVPKRTNDATAADMLRDEFLATYF